MRNEGRMIAVISIMLTMVLGAIAYGANNKHSFFSESKFSEDAIYSQERMVELSESVNKNLGLVKELNLKMSDLIVAVERLKSENSLFINESIDKFNSIESIIAAHRAVNENHESHITSLGNLVYTNTAKINSISTKLDSEDVTNLDTDYRASLDAL